MIYISNFCICLQNPKALPINLNLFDRSFCKVQFKLQDFTKINWIFFEKKLIKCNILLLQVFPQHLQTSSSFRAPWQILSQERGCYLGRLCCRTQPPPKMGMAVIWTSWKKAPVLEWCANQMGHCISLLTNKTVV